jgi:PII-like signaling protein
VNLTDESNTKRGVLVVLFIPSMQKDDVTPVDQNFWVEESTNMFAKLFRGSTAYQAIRGTYRDDSQDGKILVDQPVTVECYTTNHELSNESNVLQLKEFIGRMGREANQAEVGLVIDNNYFPFQNY